MGPVPVSAAPWSVHVLSRAAAAGRRPLNAWLNGVSCTSGTWCVAVGTVTDWTGNDRPLVERWNGSRWSRWQLPKPAEGSLYAVSCTRDRSCVAVGSVGIHGLVESLHGGVWTRQLLSQSLTGVSCTASGACTAVGGPLAFRWDGGRWRSQRTAKPRRNGPGGVALQAVSCASAGWCVAVGFNGCESLVERWNGSRWTVAQTPDTGDCTERGVGAPIFTGVSCASVSLCVAVGTLQALNEDQIDRPLTERWNGARWSRQTTGGITDAVSCPSRRSCMAVGAPPPLLAAERWNGKRWTSQALPVPTHAFRWSLDSVSCASSTMCMSVGGVTDYSMVERPLIAEYRARARG
jgi:hypothetical protein